MDAISNVSMQKVGFMDPGSLQNIVSNKALSEKEKVAVVAQEFEALMTKQILKTGMKSAFRDEDNPLTKTKGYAETFTPELAAHALSRSDVLGISKQLQKSLK